MLRKLLTFAILLLISLMPVKLLLCQVIPTGEFVKVRPTDPPVPGSVTLVLSGAVLSQCLRVGPTTVVQSGDTITLRVQIIRDITACSPPDGFCSLFLLGIPCLYSTEAPVTGLPPGTYTFVGIGLDETDTTFTIFDNGMLDSCEPCTVGDANADSSVNIADVTTMIQRIFNSGPPLLCPLDTDANGDGAFNISDVTTMISHIFGDGVLVSCP